MKTRRLLILAPLFSLAIAASSQAAILYANPFVVPGGTGGGANAGLTASVPTWAAYTGAAAELNASGSSRVWMGDRAFLNAPANTYGIVAMDGNGGNPKFLFTTTGVNIDPTAPTSEDLTFSWVQGNGGTGVSALRVTVQVGGQWYASTTTYTTAGQTAAQFGSATSTTAEEKSLLYVPTAANWTAVNFTAGSTLSLGSVATSDLVGNITGLGFFTENSFNTNNIRFANFNVTAVPEPSAALLGTLMAGGAFLRRRRK